MKENKQSVLKNTALYTLTEGVNKALNFLLLPWLSYYLVPSELGIITNYNILFTILNLISSTVFVNSITYFFYELSVKETKSLITSIVLFSFLITISLFFLICIFSDFIFKELGIGFVYQLLLLVHISSTTFISITGVLYRLRNMPYKFALFQLAQILINVCLLILLVIYYRYASNGRIIGMVITSIIMGGVSLLIMIRARLFGGFDKIIIKRLLKFSLPLFPHAISYWFRNGSDKIIITMFCGLNANGLYSMALSIAGVFTTIITSFNNAFTPDLQKKLTVLDSKTYLDSISERKKIVHQAYLYALGFFLLFLASYIFIQFCFQFVINNQYFKSQAYLPYLLLGLLFDSFYSLAIQYIYKAKKTVGLGIITFICSCSQVLLTYLLVPKVGALGAAYSALLSSLITFILISYYSYKVYPMPWFSFFNKKNF
jgi:O-antigen/teichoic acid export membrane protein